MRGKFGVHSTKHFLDAWAFYIVVFIKRSGSGFGRILSFLTQKSRKIAIKVENIRGAENIFCEMSTIQMSLEMWKF